MKAVHKNVNSPEDQSWGNIEFEKFACRVVWLYAIQGRRKVDEKNLNKRNLVFLMSHSLHALCKRVCWLLCFACIRTAMGLN